jgi:hypothetical protein
MVSNLKKQVQTFGNKIATHCKKSSPTALGLLPRLGSSNKKKMTQNHTKKKVTSKHVIKLSKLHKLTLITVHEAKCANTQTMTTLCTKYMKVQVPNSE